MCKAVSEQQFQGPEDPQSLTSPTLSYQRSAQRARARQLLCLGGGLGRPLVLLRLVLRVEAAVQGGRDHP